MKRLAMLAIVAVLAACGGDNNGPTDEFTGTWVGGYTANGDTVHLLFNATQNGSALAGSGAASDPDTSIAFSYTGTSTPPTVTMSLNLGFGVLTVNGTYVTSDSIVGSINSGSASALLFLKKQ